MVEPHVHMISYIRLNVHLFAIFSIFELLLELSTQLVAAIKEPVETAYSSLSFRRSRQLKKV